MEKITGNAVATRESESTFIIEAVHRIFRPIIRLLVGRVNCSFLLDVIRKIYIEEARRELRRQNKGRKVTKSALALMTGLDTRTIDRIDSAMTDDDQTSRAGYTSESALMERWRSDPEYLDERGQPRVLPIEGRRGSFSSLVSSCLGRNITASMMLSNLSEAGNIEVVDGSSVRVLNPWYQAISANDRVMFESGTLALNRLAGVINYNLRSPPAERLVQRERWTLRVKPDDLPEVRRQCLIATERNIAEIEQVLETFEKPDFEPLSVEFGVGWYHWLTDTEDGEERPQS